MAFYQHYNETMLNKMLLKDLLYMLALRNYVYLMLRIKVLTLTRMIFLQPL